MTGILAVLVGGRGFVSLAVAASDVSRLRSGATPDGVVTTVALPNTTITGGVAPYTQEWTLIEGADVTVSDSTALNPTFSATVAVLEPNFSIWRVTVTDAVSATAFTEIDVTLTWVQI